MAKLEEKDVKELLRAYASVAVTDELYQFGSMLVKEGVERVHWLDSKAAALAGYAGAIIVLINLTSPIWRPAASWWIQATLILAAFAVFAAGVFAVLALSLKTFEWFSDTEWIKDGCLDDADILRRYHILAMYGVRRSHEDASARKAARITWAQRIFGVAVVLLLAGAVGATVPPLLPALLNFIRVSIG